MEVREYGQILLRRWWIPVVLTLLVALFSAWQIRPWQTPPPTYTASIRMLIGVLPLADADETSYDPRYYAWLTSEYLVDDFTEVVRSQLFAQAVSQRLTDQGIQIPAGLISGSATTGERHRIITLSLNWGDRAELEQIAQAAAAELQENAASYFTQLGTPETAVTLLDGPSVGEVGPSLRNRLAFPLRLILAAIAGVVLIFIVDYLDDSVRNRRDLELLELTVLASVPKSRRKNEGK